MGIDVGFDLYPPIGKDDKDANEHWSSFWHEVRESFEEDFDVGIVNGNLVFEAGEHPILPFDGNKFRRFSSKVTGRSGGQAKVYVEDVCAIAKKYFRHCIFYWSEYGDCPNVKYSWADVHKANSDVDERNVTTIPFRTVATAVLTGFENIHVGMDGLRFKEAEFPEDAGYRIVHEMHGLGSVNRIEDWTEYVQAFDKVRAYWATRANNNCATLNGSLLSVFKDLEQRGVEKISVIVGTDFKTEEIAIATISQRKVGLTPHHVGQIVEPPVVSKVPSSPDGETFHEFLVGATEEGKFIALDCSVAQYGMRKYFPYATDELVTYLRTLGTHRLLEGLEKESALNHPFVRSKVEASSQWAMAALEDIWLA